MKTCELLEAKVKPDWVDQENTEFRELLKKFGLTTRKQPVTREGLWLFGGEIIDTEKRDITLPLEKRVAGAQKAIAQRLFNLKEQGREVVTYDVSYYSKGLFAPQRVDARPLLPDDSLAYIETRVRDKLYINTISGGGYTILFQYGLSEPKKEKPPKPVEKKVYRVVKGTK